MPDDALPQPWPTPAYGAVNLRRTYRDPLGRPMEGHVSITGRTRSVHGETVTSAVTVTVPVVRGAIDVHLPPDTYRIDAALRTIDGARATETETVTLEG